jgi:hypothetical protein
MEGARGEREYPHARLLPICARLLLDGCCLLIQDNPRKLAITVIAVRGKAAL